MSGITTSISTGSIGPNGASVLSSYNTFRLSKSDMPANSLSPGSSVQRTTEAASTISTSGYGHSKYMGRSKHTYNSTQQISNLAPQSLASKTRSAATASFPSNDSHLSNPKPYAGPVQSAVKPMDGKSGSVEIGGIFQWGGSGGTQGSAYIKGQVNDGKGNTVQGQITQNSNGQGSVNFSAKKEGKPK